MIYEKFEQETRNLKYPDKARCAFRDLTQVERNEHTAKRHEWQDKVNAVNKSFMLALFKEHGVENNPKAQKVFELAWSHGHSGGYSEVEIYFEEFVELIK